MTIFRCEIALPMLRDVFATWDDWHGELHTVTGYGWDEYQNLAMRLAEEPTSSLTLEDEAMLMQAANQFFGYPGIKTKNLEAAFGQSWPQQVTRAFREENHL